MVTIGDSNSEPDIYYTFENESKMLFKSKAHSNIQKIVFPLKLVIEEELLPSLNYNYYIGIYEEDTLLYTLIVEKLSFNPNKLVEDFKKRFSSQKHPANTIELENSFVKIQIHLTWDSVPLK